ncbi:copper amine oxidase N-terminal domain-containing protein [Cohnella rhizosphaerae]|uniref:Copper amine oxidase N-terminal domain-containing protein n=1 Tax=Cohnella rhizosphaerae TaxID=1457232 RepID=A0A9X4KVF5_9BACL|nr:copper amine oxidase N-terminal domain-containing protein [Cohnella rhizosphaerae]MDG0811845.1 copper amine oxidase N-terminal domain-containing protein [Cohnella rhizosphaerae]
MKSKRNVIAAALMGAMLLSVPVAASAASTAIAVESKPIVMEFDGKKLALPSGQVAFMYQSKVYIPLRFASYALQKQVGYDATTKTVTVKEPTSSEKVALKEYLANAAASGDMSSSAVAKVKLVPTAVKLVFDGVEKKLPTGQQAYNVNGSIYVPVRFISEAVGTTVLWDAKTGTVSGESKAYRESQSSGGTSSGTSGSTNGNAGTGGSTSGSGSTGGTGSGGNGGGVTTPSYDSITSGAYSRLDTLRTSCKNNLTDIGFSYLAASTAEQKTALVTQAHNAISSCKAQFESILSDTESQLKAGGYSTDVLNDYRSTFNAEMEAGQQLVDQYMK